MTLSYIVDKKQLTAAGVILGAGIIVSAALFGFNAGAQNIFSVTFPVTELGNCGSFDECRTYCDDLSHVSECADFAASRGLATSAQVQQVKNIPKTGPGGCGSEESCRTYCDDSANAEECIAFGEKNGLMSKAEAGHARKLNQPGPGGCRGKDCQTYCENAARQDECFEFAANNGFIPKDQADKIRQQKEKFKASGGTGPGGCRGDGECRDYCDNPDNLEECLNFAITNDLMTATEATRIRGIAGRGPGGCRGEKECRQYCEDPVHGEECLAFAEEHDLIPKEELALARKVLSQGGPGGCKGEKSCQDYCDNPDNIDECFDFASKEGLIPQAEVEQARKFIQASKQGGPGGCRGRKCQDYCNDSTHRDECFEFAKTQGILPPEELQHFEKGRQIEKRMKESGGPGGCKDENSCRDYCSDPTRVKECLNFAVDAGGFSPEEAQKSLEQFTKFKEFGNNLRQRPGEFIGADFDPADLEKRFQEFGVEGFDPSQLQGFGPGQGGFGPPVGGGFGPQGGFGSQGRFGQLGQQGGGFGGPGGCQGLEECSNFCQDPAHSSECNKFGGPPSTQGRGGGLESEGKQQGDSRDGGFPFPGQSGEFPGQGRENFPGRGPGDRFPQGFPGQGQGESQGQPGEFPEGFPGGQEGKFPQGFQPNIRGIQEQQTKQQFQQQFQQEFQQQRQQQGEFRPQENGGQPTGGFAPQSGGSFNGGSGFFSPQTGGSFESGGGSFSPAPSEGGSFSPPPLEGSQPPPPPTSFNSSMQPLGFILGPILNIFR